MNRNVTITNHPKSNEKASPNTDFDSTITDRTALPFALKVFMA